MPRLRLPARLPAALADDDRTLLARFADGRDDAAFAALVGRHARMVYGVCKRAVRDEHLAEDAFQAVFLVLAKNPAGAASASSVGGWLFGVARRVGLAARRHEQRRNRLPDPRSGESSAPDFGDLMRALDEELAKLPDEYRAPLVACFLEERTLDEAARHLGWSVSTLRRRLDRGKELLRARLTRRGATLGAGLFAGVLAPSARAAVPGRLLEAVAEPTPFARALAAEAVRGSFFVKAWLPFVAVAVTLAGLAAGSAGERPEQPPRSPDPVGASHAAAAPAPRPAARAPWVTVSGQVVFPEERDLPKPRLVPAGALKDAMFFAGATYDDLQVHATNRGLANAVVWLRPDSDDPKAQFPADKIRRKAEPTTHLVEAGRDGFTPRVLAARVGDRITFGNPTPIAFNVRYQRPTSADAPMGEETGEFNILLAPGKTHTSAPLTRTRICDLVGDGIHPWVKAYVLAFDHPHSAVTDASGKFTIPDVPEGTWRVVVWHEKVGYRYAAKGRLGEAVVIRGDGKQDLGRFVHATHAWNEALKAEE